MTLCKWMVPPFLFAACAFLSVPAVGQGKPLNVLVVNGAGQPVPTAAQGTTNVAGTVSLAAGASVNVTNPLDSQNNPTPLATLEATQPYESSCNISFNGSATAFCRFATVPSGKRLVVQEFDAGGELEAGLMPIVVQFSPAGLRHWFSATFMGSQGGFDWFATHQATQLYVNPGQMPTCFVDVSNNSSGVYFCQLSGFLVDVS